MSIDPGDTGTCSGSNRAYNSYKEYVKALSRDQEMNLAENDRVKIIKLCKREGIEHVDDIQMVTDYKPLSAPGSEPLPVPWTQLEIMFDML